MSYDPTKKFEEMTASDFAAAMTSALTSYGVAKSGDYTPGSNNYEPSSSDYSSGTNTEISNIQQSQGNMNDTSNEVHNRLIDLENTLKLAGQGINVYNGALSSLSSEFKPFLKQLNSLQEDYGGITLDPDEAVGAAKAVSERLQSMQEMYYTESGDQMAASLGFADNALAKYYDNEKEAFDAAEDVLRRLVEQHSQFVNQMDEQTLYKLPMYTKALGVNNRELAEVLEQQINRTGKATTEILDEIAVYSDGLAKSTGIPMKSISANAVRIVKDTQRWGDTTAEEATRIAAQLGQLGQTYDSFTGLIDKFQEFGSAAETSGLISQITGGAVNLDAQHLMYLASEEKEKFLPELRRSLLAGGFDQEAYLRLSEAEQRQMAQTFSLNRENMISLLDTRREFDATDLLAEQEKIDKSGKGAAEALEDNMELAAKATDNLTETMRHHRAKALLANKKELLLNAEAYSELNSKMRSVDFTDANKAAELYNKTLELQRSGIGKITEVIPDKGSVTDVGNYISNQMETTRAKQKALGDGSQTEFFGEDSPDKDPENAPDEGGTPGGGNKPNTPNKFFGEDGIDISDESVETLGTKIGEVQADALEENKKETQADLEQALQDSSGDPNEASNVNLTDSTVTAVGAEFNSASNGVIEANTADNNQNLQILSTQNDQNTALINDNVNTQSDNTNTAIEESTKPLSDKIDTLTTTVNNLINAGEKEVILQMDGKQVGKIVIGNRYTVGGAPVKIQTVNV